MTGDKPKSAAVCQQEYDEANAAFKVAERKMLDAWHALQAARRREGK